MRQLEALDLEVSPRTLVGHLQHAEKAIVALSRAMQGGARVIVLDEVTAALPSPDAARVHKSFAPPRPLASHSSTSLTGWRRYSTFASG